MTRYKFYKAMRLLDHAIEHLGPTKACGLMIEGGKIVGCLPSDDTNANVARAVLARASCELVKECHDLT